MPDTDQALLDRLAHVSDLLAAAGPEAIGSRLRRVRIRQGRSIRDLADAAGVNKNSVVRLEQGRGTQPTTVLRICTALGLHVERLAEATSDALTLSAVHRAADDQWVDMTDFGAGPLVEDGMADGAARRRAVADGAGVPLNLLASRLPEGRVLPTVLELHAPSERRSHPGEEFVYVLSGRVRVDVGPESHVLETGESMTFYSAEPHAYAPEGDAVPSTLLSVRVEG